MSRTMTVVTSLKGSAAWPKLLRLSLLFSLLWCHNALVDLRETVACVRDTRKNEEERKLSTHSTIISSNRPS
jgi:hypothetical protein